MKLPNENRNEHKGHDQLEDGVVGAQHKPAVCPPKHKGAEKVIVEDMKEGAGKNVP